MSTMFLRATILTCGSILFLTSSSDSRAQASPRGAAPVIVTNDVDMAVPVSVEGFVNMRTVQGFPASLSTRGGVAGSGDRVQKTLVIEDFFVGVG